MKKILLLLLLVTNISIAQINLVNTQTINISTRNQLCGNGLQVRDTGVFDAIVVMNALRGFGLGIAGINNQGVFSWSSAINPDSSYYTQWQTDSAIAAGGSITVSDSAWSLNGNSITGNKVLGTTNNRSLNIITNDTVRVVVDSLGNVGIGTVTPSAKLQVEQSDNNNSAILIYQDGVPVFGIDGVASATNVHLGEYTGAHNNTYIDINDGDKKIIIPNGNVGIGTPNADTTLHLVGKFKYIDGTQGANKVLQSDAVGLASWQQLNLDTLLTPTTAQVDTIADGYTGVVFTGGATAVTYTLTLPENPYEGQRILIGSDDVIITALTLDGNGNSISTGLATNIAGLFTGGGIQHTLRFKNGTWY